MLQSRAMCCTKSSRHMAMICCANCQWQREITLLQRVTACCSVRQCDAACCSVFHSVAVRYERDVSVSSITWCACCSVMHSVAECCSVLQYRIDVAGCMHIHYMVCVRCGVLQCVAVCCSVLQCVAVCCSVLRMSQFTHTLHMK